jgi:type III secretion protein D
MNSDILGEIVLISGEQSGARARLKNNASMSISGNLDTDIVIRDQLITDELIKLSTKGNEVFLQCMVGSVELDGKVINQSKNIKLKENAKVKIGNTIFVHQKQLNIPIQEILKQKENESVSTNTQTNHVKTKNVYKNYSIAVSVFMFIALVFITPAIIKSYASKSGQVELTEEQSTMNLLKSNGFEGLKVTRNSYDQLVISGFVFSNKERAQIEKIIDENGIPAVHDLKVGDQLAKEVRELYRINGADIEAAVVNSGSVIITAEETKADDILRIKEIALKEITGLKSLEVEYVNSAPGDLSIGAEMSYNNEDKRITMVVDGDPAYILTSDQAKYYVGALLPTGYKILAISDQKVVVEKQGKQTILNF